jgi:hypothetical protein
MFKSLALSIAVGALLVGAVVATVLPTANAYQIAPLTNCFTDNDCTNINGVDGYCHNRVCFAPLDQAPPVCADRCATLPYCDPAVATCGGHAVVVSGTTVHVNDCRGIQSGARGGVISYCDQTGMAPPPDRAPVGFIDGVFGPSPTDTVGGWSVDQDTPSTNTLVQLYIDGPAGVGTGFTVTANVARSDVNTWCTSIGIPCPGAHGFSWAIPAMYKNGVMHTVYAYGINTAPGKPNTFFGTKTFTLGAVVAPTPTPTPMRTPTPTVSPPLTPTPTTHLNIRYSLPTKRCAPQGQAAITCATAAVKRLP